MCFYTISRLYYSIAEIRNDLILGKINRGPCVFPFHGLERRRNLQHENAWYARILDIFEIGIIAKQLYARRCNARDLL